MSEPHHLADALKRLFLNNSGWFASFSDAIAGLSAEQAAKVPAPGFNNVWMVVNHINFWQDLMLKRLHDIWVDRAIIGEGQGWKQPTPADDEQAWQAACAYAVELNNHLTMLIPTLGVEALNRPIETWDESKLEAIHGLIAHNSYHINEIISIRHMNGYWLEKT